MSPNIHDQLKICLCDLSFVCLFDSPKKKKKKKKKKKNLYVFFLMINKLKLDFRNS